MIKNIIFDIGNVILFFDYKKIVQGISKDPADIAFIVKHVINSPEWLGYGLLDLGVISAEDAVIAIQDRTEHTHDRLVEDFLLHSQEDRKVDPGIREEIIKLKQEGYKVYLLSNIPHIRYDFIRNTSDLFDIVDGMVLSCLVKKIKPHESIYKELLAKFKSGAVDSPDASLDNSNVNVDIVPDADEMKDLRKYRYASMAGASALATAM